MSKVGSHDPFEHLKHKLWPKEGPGVQLAIWLSITKSQKSPQFPYVQVACDIPLESSRQGYNFSLNLIPIKGLHAKLWAPKVVGVPTIGISGLPVGNPRTKWHLGAGPVVSHKAYYKGEGGGFPQGRAVVSLMSLNLPVARPGTKSVPTMHKETCCLVLCTFVWVIKCFSFFLIPS
jgi:hypothetical protein